MKLINRFSKPIVLDDGTILASAGTKGSTKEVESISDRDRRRYVEPGTIVIVAEPEPAPVKIMPPVVATEKAPASESPSSAKPPSRQAAKPDAKEEGK